MRILESKPVDDEVALDVAEVRRILGKDPGDVLSRYRDRLETIVRESPNEHSFRSELAVVCAVQGDTARLRAVIQELVRMTDPVGNPLIAYNVDAARALALAWSGDRAAAIDILQRLVKSPGPTLDGYDLKYSLSWWPLRGDPRFEALLADPATFHPPY